jgi:hypothetical protein
MKLKFLLAFALMIGVLYAGVIFVPSDTLHFNYVTYSPTIDGTHEYDEGECSQFVNDDLTARYCYYKDDLYLYFFISDDESDSGDYFHLGFDTNKDEILAPSEPKIIIYRDGTITNPGNWEYETVTTGRGGWRGEILVPFVDVGLPINLGAGKTQDGPNIRLKAVGGSEGLLGTFYGSGVGETDSISYWSQPQSFTVKPTSYTTPSQWVRETDNMDVKMLEFSIATNNEEPFNLTQLIFDASGTGNEQDDIEKVDLYLTTGPTRELIGSTYFTHDNGVLTFPISVPVKGIHSGPNTRIFELIYTMDSQAGSVGSSAATFEVDLTAVGNTGVYTGEKLPVNNIPFESGSLFTYDCATDSGCADDEFCDNKICKDVIPGSACGYAADHTWNDYECCADTDCSGGYVCVDHACVEESIAPPPETTDPEPTDPTPEPEPVIVEPPLANATAPPTIPEGNGTTNDSGTPPGTLPDTVSINNTSTAPSPDTTAPGSTDNQTEITSPKPSDPWMDDASLLLAGAAIVILGAGLIYYYKFRKK